MVESSRIARAEACLALRQVTTVDAHQRGAAAVVEHPAGVVVVVLALAVVHQVGEVEEEAVLRAGEEMADAQPTVEAMEPAQPMAAQQHMAVLLPMEAGHRMVEAQLTAETTATALHMEATTLAVAVARLAGAALAPATQHPSQTCLHPHLELTMPPRQERTQRQHLVAMGLTLRLPPADPWMLPRLATTLHRHQETHVTASRPLLRRRRVHGTFLLQRRVERIPATIERIQVVR